jgi:tetratricopeptide (TPR) repeat protein
MSSNAQPSFDDLWDDDLWDYNDPAASEAKFRALIPRVEADGNPSHLGELLSQMARAQGLQGNFTGAHTTLDHVEALLPEVGLHTRIRYLLERGRAYNSGGSPERAKPLFAEAWELGKGEPAERYYAVDAAHMLAIVGSPEEQIAWNRRAIELAKASEDARVRRWCASLYNNLGWTYSDSGGFAEALGCFQEALVWREQRGPAREIRIARWNVGRALRLVSRNDEALALQQALLAEWEASGEEQDGYVFEEVGECLLALGRAEESRLYFAQAYELLARDEWLQGHQPDRLARVRELGAARGGAFRPDETAG